MIWTALDSIAIEECLDSISLLEMKAYKYMTHLDELSEDEKNDIITNAKKCATKYGNGVHLMRSIASSFDDTDFREYDVDCEEQVEEGFKNAQLDYRSINDDFVIIPNPSNGVFEVIVEENKQILDLNLTDINGKLIFNMHHINKNNVYIQQSLDSGVYFIEIRTNNGISNVKKIIVTQ